MSFSEDNLITYLENTWDSDVATTPTFTTDRQLLNYNNTLLVQRLRLSSKAMCADVDEKMDYYTLRLAHATEAAVDHLEDLLKAYPGYMGGATISDTFDTLGGWAITKDVATVTVEATGNTMHGSFANADTSTYKGWSAYRAYTGETPTRFQFTAKKGVQFPHHLRIRLLASAPVLNQTTLYSTDVMNVVFNSKWYDNDDKLFIKVSGLVASFAYSAAFTENVDYTIKITFNYTANTYDAYVNDVKVITGGSFSGSNVAYILIEEYDMGLTGTTYESWISALTLTRDEATNLTLLQKELVLDTQYKGQDVLKNHVTETSFVVTSWE